jgi:predicted HicB family RNase H-like nuclease
VKSAAQKRAEKTADKDTAKPQTVRIILHDKNGDVVVDLDIPEVLHAAMLRSAKRQGISFQQWIKKDKLELQVLGGQSVKDGGAR